MFVQTEEFFVMHYGIMNDYKGLHSVAKTNLVQIDLYYGAYHFHVMKNYDYGKKLFRLYF
jgi:hypothetical protein